MTHLSGDVGGDDGQEELLLVLLLALQPHPRLDAAARPLHRPLPPRHRHVLVVQPHEVADGEQEAVRYQLQCKEGSERTVETASQQNNGLLKHGHVGFLKFRFICLSFSKVQGQGSIGTYDITKRSSREYMYYPSARCPRLI